MAVSPNPSKDNHPLTRKETDEISSTEVERIVQERMAALEKENAALHQEIAFLKQADTERKEAEKVLRESQNIPTPG